MYAAAAAAYYIHSLRAEIPASDASGVI